MLTAYCNILIFIFSLKIAAEKIEYIYCAPKDLNTALGYHNPSLDTLINGVGVCTLYLQLILLE